MLPFALSLSKDSLDRPVLELSLSAIPAIVLLVLIPCAVGGTALLTLPMLKVAGLPFFRTNGFVFFIVGVIGLAFADRAGILRLSPARVLFDLFLLLLVVYNLRLWLRHPYHSRLLLYIALVAGGAGLFALARFHAGAAPLPSALLFASFLSSGLLMGTGSLAMLLGHRYLTAPSLSMAPLDHLTRIFFWLLCVECGLTAMNLFFSSDPARIGRALRLGTFEGIYLWARILVGLATPLLLAAMIRQAVRERATMSATGLLYIAMLMVFIGEIFARFFLLTGAVIL